MEEGWVREQWGKGMHSHRSVTRASTGVFACLGLITSTAATALLLTAMSNQPAWADGPKNCPPGTGWNDQLGACIEITIPGDDTGEPGEDPDPGGGVTECHDEDGSVVACTKDGMTWWGSPHYCYAEPQNPQGDPPRGHENEEGMWWSCEPDCAGSNCSGEVWWVVGGAASVDGAAVARQMVVTIPFELADAKIAPPPTYHTYISYENWLWIESAQWRTVSQTKSLQGATVTLTATPSYVEWDMGNDDTKSCVGPGRAWVKGMSENAPTNCSYAYDSMEDPEGDTWTVSAQINYTLAWTCSGNCGGSTSGDLGSQLAAAGDSTTITVLQRQTVNKNGG